MFFKVTYSGADRYVQLIEAYHDDAGRPKQRAVVNLGRDDQLNSELDSVISATLRVSGKAAPAATLVPTISFESARDFGDVWALTELWSSLGFDRLNRVFRRTRHAIDVEVLVRAMVLNRLCESESKLGVLRWVHTVTLPGAFSGAIEHQNLLRAMNALVEHQDEVEVVLASLLRPLVDQDLAVVFYDMTTIRAAGLSEQISDVRQFGMSKEGVIARLSSQHRRAQQVFGSAAAGAGGELTQARGTCGMLNPGTVTTVAGWRLRRGRVARAIVGVCYTWIVPMEDSRCRPCSPCA